MHGEQFIEDDVDTTSDGIFHYGLVQYSTFESDSHSLREDSARDGVDVGLWYLGAIDKEGGALAEDGTNIRLGNGEDGNVLCLDVGEEGDQAVL